METYIGFYFNKNTGLWIRATKPMQNGSSVLTESDSRWKEFGALYPRHQEKLSLLLMLNVPHATSPRMERLATVGSVRHSILQRGFVFYKLYNEAWRKEL